MGGGSSDDRRRTKAAVFVIACGLAGGLPHGLGSVSRLVSSLALASLLGVYLARTAFFRPPMVAKDSTGASDLTGAADPGQQADPGEGSAATAPLVDVVVAARDEEAVIGRLVERVTALAWPAEALRLWVIDDGSEDRTPQRLAALQADHPQLQVVRRSREAGGGKSGALNLVLQQLQGRWMLVLDADADLAPDLLQRLIPFAEGGGWSAVQLRKAEVNAGVNWLTRSQAMEMAFDAFIQEGRLARGGLTELRGNGQLLLRQAVEAVGGFNEATITDDLDLSLRLLLAAQPVGVLWNPPVAEEAVLSLPALWRQRQRWAEGGLQRFFDYGDQLFSSRLNGAQKLDLAAFFVLQYVLPVMALADLVGALVTGTGPGMWPFSLVALGLAGSSMVAASRRVSEGPALPTANPLNLLVALVYLTHWFVVIPWVSLKMALLPKSLVWAKTAHGGAEEAVSSELDDDEEVPAIEIATESPGG
jgi:1,2-diacylglycerol 3-beta-glucosyltransferase